MEHHLTAMDCHLSYGITVLPSIRHKWTHPAFTPASQAGTRFTYPGGMEGWVELGDLLHTEMVYPPADGHPSKYLQDRVLINFVDQANAANHCTTPPQDTRCNVACIWTVGCNRYVTLVLPSGKHTRRHTQRVVAIVLELWLIYRRKSGRTSTNLELSNTMSTALLCCFGNYWVRRSRLSTVLCAVIVCTGLWSKTSCYCYNIIIIINEYDYPSSLNLSCLLFICYIVIKKLIMIIG